MGISAALRLLPYLALAATLGVAYWLGRHHRGTQCANEALEAASEAQQQAITLAGIADAAAAQREQSRIIQQAALAGARKAIAEAPHDSCIDADAGAVLDGLRAPRSAP